MRHAPLYLLQLRHKTKTQEMTNEEGKVNEPLVIEDEILTRGLGYLTQQDPDFERVVARLGPPPLWAREPGFGGLLRTILGQQVSETSARRAFSRLLETASPLTPERFLELDDAALKKVGFSRQKARYGRVLAEAVASGALDLGGLEALEDDAVRAELTRLPGLGPWTADVYLLMSLRRPDVWPVGDLAIVLGVQHLKGLAEKPTKGELVALAEPWRPWRSVAARLVWHHYLRGRA